jgi:hypothetical protein
MTMRKKDNLLRGDRTPAYVGRETGAAELQISPDTWDQWVKEGRLPRPCDGFPPGTPRWRWADVDRKLSGQAIDHDDAYIRGAANIAAMGDTTDLLMRGAANFGKKGDTADLAMKGALNFGNKAPPKKKIGRPRTVTVPAPPRTRS